MDASDEGSVASGARRGLLRAVGIAGVASLAGCTADVGEELPENREWPVSEYLPSLPVESRSELVAAEIERTADADVREPEDLRGVFDGRPFDIGAIERRRDVLVVEYAGTDRYGTGDLHAVGPLAGAYAALIHAGDDAASMSLSILDDAPSSYGVATVETRWAESYNAGELSANEYGEHVAGTIESRRDAPDVGVSPVG